MGRRKKEGGVVDRYRSVCMYVYVNMMNVCMFLEGGMDFCRQGNEDESM